MRARHRLTSVAEDSAGRWPAVPEDGSPRAVLPRPGAQELRGLWDVGQDAETSSLQLACLPSENPLPPFLPPVADSHDFQRI